MKILAIDTSGPNCSIAIINDEKVIGHFSINIGQTHSETLLPLVDDLLKYEQLTLDEIDAFACCTGPGSFTGIRIGIATIKGFALATNKPVIAISSLASLAYNIPFFEGVIASVLDANHGNIYAALYQGQNSLKQLGDYYTDSINDWIENLKLIPQKILFVGDGAIAYHDLLAEKLQEKACFVPHHINELSAISLARIALEKMKKNEIDVAENIHPLYLRKSQAERMAEQQ